ncbi:MAG: NUDIX domain-containing protein [Candidatus Saccharibacteria bacterium]|nr:NUDIX domain-containing protein [Rhodoferax sp.]
MKLNSEVCLHSPRDAATVVMLRDGDQGLEVFLVKRHGLSDVLGGAYVFPGGKLDAADLLLEVHVDQPMADLHSALGEVHTPPATALGLYVAALREAFEESGILFASDALASQATLSKHSQLSFNAWVHQRAMTLQTRQLLPWTRWITPLSPSVSSKRFDTRFFVAEVPADQTARHDDYETTASAWFQPKLALQQYWDRQIELAPPQIMSLAHLSRHTSVHSVLQEARQRPPPVILPESYDEAGERLICYPGDPLHSVSTRAIPGPTRVYFRNRRFEPADGFEALFTA